MNCRRCKAFLKDSKSCGLGKINPSDFNTALDAVKKRGIYVLCSKNKHFKEVNKLNV